MTDPTCVVPTCAQPDRPIHDQAYACPACTRGLAHDLRDVAKVAGEAETTIARLDKVARPAVASQPDQDWHKADNALRPSPLPYRAEVADRYAAAVNDIQTWAAHIIETTGKPWPDLPRQEHPLRGLCEWLAAEKQLDWLRHRQEADEAYVALSAACRVIVRLVDRPADREFVGRCPCGTDLYRVTGRGEIVTCQGCGTRYDAATLRADLLRRAGDRLYTPAEIADLAMVYGIPTRRDLVRDLIRKWGKRGHLVRHEYPGEADGVYRLDDALARLGSSITTNRLAGDIVRSQKG